MVRTNVETKPSLPYTTDPKDFNNFISRLEKCEKLHKPLENTLANIFSMRYIGNKTHGDMAEVAITEFIKCFMYDYDCRHVGKELFRSKEHEEDIAVKIGNQNLYIPISLKAYGLGPLQISTDKENVLYDYLKNLNNTDITGRECLNSIKEKIKATVMFNVLPLIYKEKEIKGDTEKTRKYDNKCNIFLFDVGKMMANLSRIVYVNNGEEYDYQNRIVQKKVIGKQRKHPIFLFLDNENNYICEVRYGGADANALQRGLWSNTKKGESYFKHIFPEWIKYDKREDLILLIQKALNCSPNGHKNATQSLDSDISNIKTNNGIEK